MRIYKNVKPQNRLRVVFWEEDGKPTSYMHIEDTEARTFLKILKEIAKYDDWVWSQKICRKLKIPRVTFSWTIARMAGARYIDRKKNGSYHRLMTGPLVLVRKEIVNGNVRRGLARPCRKPAIYVKRGRNLRL